MITQLLINAFVGFGSWLLGTIPKIPQAIIDLINSINQAIQTARDFLSTLNFALPVDIIITSLLVYMGLLAFAIVVIGISKGISVVTLGKINIFPSGGKG